MDNMEMERETVTFMLREDANGRQVYTLQTDENNEFQFETEEEQAGEVQQDSRDFANIKMERMDVTEDSDLDEPPLDEAEEHVLADGSVEASLEDGEIVMHGATDSLTFDSDDENDSSVPGKRRRLSSSSDPNDVLTQHMDIREPLNTLRMLLEGRIGASLKDYKFWLQDAQVLEGHKNLVDQCVQGEGLVQVNLQIVSSQKKINIVDVLKPAEDYVEPVQAPVEEPIRQIMTPVDPKQNVVRWIVDSNFKKDQERLKIPGDPNDWSVAHVRHWLQWAVRTFNLAGLRLVDWNITGRELCHLELSDFQAKVPSDPGDLFWTHLELLRKCKFVAVVQRQPEKIQYIAQPEPRAIPHGSTAASRQARSRPGVARSNRIIGSALEMISSPGNRTGNNGQVQLWQFLLELLTDKDRVDVIGWVSNDGEFKLKNPEMVAHLWGERKNKPTMNYEKLSRALRYYYDGDMIAKVYGKRFVYKFVCDLKNLMGYSASKLSSLVSECVEKNYARYPGITDDEC